MQPGFQKIIHLDPYFPTGEATVQPVVLWANGRACYEGITKHASVGADYFKTIKPEPGHTFVYVLALGAWETYGENRNGDGFPEFPYMEHLSPPAISAQDVLPVHYKTFEEFGHNYRHHANKDPEKKVGDVVQAFWNPMMHRVELLVKLINDRAPDLVERIAAGEFPPVSMGTRVKYDVCTICYNRAPTRAQYCTHLKNQMRDVIDGKKVAALNPSPKFFDISWVYRGADKTAFLMKKVANISAPYELISGAEAGEYLDRVNQQKLAARKMAVMDKIIQGIPVDSSEDTGFSPSELGNMKSMRSMVLDAGKNTPDFPDGVLDFFSQFSFPKIFSSLTASGLIQLSTPEVTKVVLFKSYPNKAVPDNVLSKAVVAQRGVLELLEDFPNIMDKLKETGILDMGVDKVDEKIVKAAAPWFEKRSGIPEYLKRRFVPEKWKQPDAPYSTPLSITDPATGQQYRTTRGAAIRAHDEVAKRNLYKILGGGMLLGGAYKLISHAMPGRYKALRPLVALGLGGLGATQLPSMGKHYMTDQGIPVPAMTELAKTSAANPYSLALPVLGTLGTMAALGHDYQSRMRSGIPMGYEGLPLSRRILDTVSEFSHDHPLLTAGLGIVGGHRLGKTLPAQILKRKGSQALMPVTETARGLASEARKRMQGLAKGVKVSAYLENDLPTPSDTVVLPDIDLDKVAEWLGWVVLEG